MRQRILETFGLGSWTRFRRSLPSAVVIWIAGAVLEMTVLPADWVLDAAVLLAVTAWILLVLSDWELVDEVIAKFKRYSCGRYDRKP